MKRKDFESLVRRYDQKAEENPLGFKRGVTFFAAFGYAFFGLLLLLALLLTGLVLGLFVSAVLHGVKGTSVGGIQAAIFCAAIDIMLIRALWVRFPMPPGLRLKREDMPLLFDDVEEIRTLLQCPPVHQIILTDEFNAAMSQDPRLGIFGWYRNTLIVGLPFLHSMSRHSLRAVVAHELGHLSRLHGHYAVRIYRIAEMWRRLAEESEGVRGSWLVRKFVAWYAPRLHARAFALQKAGEYEADAASVAIVGAQETARLLIGIHARGPSLERAARGRFGALAREGGYAAPGLATAACLAAQEPLPAAEADRALNLMVLAETDYDDTHPCLLDRLAAIGFRTTPADAGSSFEQQGLWPFHVSRRAVEDYLPGGDQAVRERLDEKLRKAGFAEYWKLTQEKLKEARTKLAELDARAAKAPLGAVDVRERAAILQFAEGEPSALAYLQAEAVRFPEDMRLRYEIGRLLVEDDNEEGIALLEEVATKERASTGAVCEVLYSFYKRNSRHSDAREILLRSDAHREVMDKAHAERLRVSRKDRFAPHDLDDDTLAALIARLDAHAPVLKAWLIRKEVQHLAESKAYILVCQFKLGWTACTSEGEQIAIEKLLPELEVLPFEYVIWGFESAPGQLRAATKKTPGAFIFERRKRPSPG